MTIDEASAPSVEVWPDNLSVTNILLAMSTQWRTAGMAGVVTGLDYSALPTVLRMSGIPRKDWNSVFQDLRVMEDTALSVMHRVK